MACERKWKLDEFKTTIVTHKVLGKLARRILWGTYSTAGALLAAFRVEPDGSFVNALGGALDAMEAHVGIVHPATLEAGDRSAWSDVFRQQNLQQPLSSSRGRSSR